MSPAFVYDAVRTPFGRYGGALARTRPDDLAATVVRAVLARHPGLDPRPGRRGRPRLRQRRRRGQPQRRPDGRAARRAPGVGARVDGEPAVRVESRRRDGRLAQHRGGGRRRRPHRRCRVDVACALGAAQAGAAVPRRQRRARLDDARLAAGQPGDAERVDGVARRVQRAARRAARHPARAPGRARAALAPARRRGVARRLPRRARRPRRRRRPHPRRGHPRGHLARAARRPDPVLPPRRDDHRGQRLAAQRRRVRRPARLGGGR